MPTPDPLPNAGWPMAESTVLFAGHQLVPIVYGEDRFGCAVIAPGDEVLQRLGEYATAGEALVQGQLWLMKQLKRDLSRTSLQAPRLRQPRRER